MRYRSSVAAARAAAGSAGRATGGMPAVDYVYHLVVALTQIGVAVWTTLVIKGVKDGIDYRPD